MKVVQYSTLLPRILAYPVGAGAVLHHLKSRCFGVGSGDNTHRVFIDLYEIVQDFNVKPRAGEGVKKTIGSWVMGEASRTFIHLSGPKVTFKIRRHSKRILSWLF